MKYLNESFEDFVNESKKITPQIGDDVRGFGHKYGAIIRDVYKNTFKIPYNDYWDSSDVWISFDKVKLEVEDDHEPNTWRKK
jgi:hypothetical protein